MVALHPEGVDRNAPLNTMTTKQDSRPPPGGRG